MKLFELTVNKKVYTEPKLNLLSAHSKSYGFSFRHRNFNMWTKIAFLGIAMISTINGNYNYVKCTCLYVLQFLMIRNSLIKQLKVTFDKVLYWRIIEWCFI